MPWTLGGSPDLCPHMDTLLVRAVWHPVNVSSVLIGKKSMG